MTAKTKKLFTILLTTLAIAAFVITPLAWFASYWNSNPAGFKPGYNTSMPEVTMWLYYSANDAPAGTTNVDYWKKYTSNTKDDSKNGLLDLSDPNIFIPAVEEDEEKTTYEYVYESLHFGKVDNLVNIREDNKIYMCFKFNVEDHGSDFMNISLLYNTSGYSYEEGKSVLDSFHLYKMEATPDPGEDKEVAAEQNLYSTNNSTNDYILKYNDDKPAAMQFLQFKYAISTTAYNTPEAFSALTFSEAVPINCGRELACGKTGNEACKKCEACKPCEAGKCGTVGIDSNSANATWDALPDADGKLTDSDYYYLYIELTPLLDAFGMQENILDYFVPSYMLFDVKFDIEIG